MKPRDVSLRLSITDACQLRCRYCRTSHTKLHPSRTGRLSCKDFLNFITEITSLVGISKLRITGGEPLLYPDLIRLIAGCAQIGIRDLALTTNGQRLARLADDLKDAGLQRINVSLDSLDPATFRYITRGGELQWTLDGIEKAEKSGLTPLKLNMVMLKGVNDSEIVDLAEFAIRNGCQIRFLELMPIGAAAKSFDDLFLSCNDAQKVLREHFRLEPLDSQIGETSRNFLMSSPKDGTTICGFISPVSHPFCKGCNRLRLTSDGCLYGCLAKRSHIALQRLFTGRSAGDRDDIRKAILDAFSMKRKRPWFEEQQEMAAIGG